MVLIVDPPSGWKYGFPAPAEDDYGAQLRLHKYPEKDIEFAMRHSRYYNSEED
jgi:hypothetical protein